MTLIIQHMHFYTHIIHVNQWYLYRAVDQTTKEPSYILFKER